ncbi:MAG: hypothetical protein HKL86_06735, partial [Acidimicrobiaceae bacterium]|nr:hypothetical protein [Acidimicrobiaceae bacterium]
RIEPRRGQVDWAALERYARVVRHARALGLGVTVVLFDAAWPSWLGLEAWLMPWTVPYVLAHARRVGEKVANDVTGMVVFADPQRLSEGGFVRAQCPPWRRGALEDARYARRQIAGVEDELSRDPVLGPLLVRSSREISLDLTPGEISALRDRSAHVDEVYVRSLVRGCGPTAVARGLLERDGAGWRIALSDELLEVLR